MTNPLTKALRAQIDQRTADYVDAAISDALAVLAEKLAETNGVLGNQASQVTQIDQRLTEAEGLLAAASRDDRYLLTKAKLVQLMKDMGYL